MSNTDSCEADGQRELLPVENLLTEHQRRPVDIALEATHPLPASLVEEIIADCRRIAMERGEL